MLPTRGPLERGALSYREPLPRLLRRLRRLRGAPPGKPRLRDPLKPSSDCDPLPRLVRRLRGALPNRPRRPPLRRRRLRRQRAEPGKPRRPRSRRLLPPTGTGGHVAALARRRAARVALDHVHGHAARTLLLRRLGPAPHLTRAGRLPRVPPVRAVGLRLIPRVRRRRFPSQRGKPRRGQAGQAAASGRRGAGRLPP